MNWTKTWEGALAAAGAVALVRMDVYAPWFGILLAAMVLDYVTGILSAAYLGRLSSAIGVKGIMKKVGYWLLVAGALVVDWAAAKGSDALGLSFATGGMVALATTLWLILNEVLSLLENLGEMDISLPAFLVRAIHSLKSRVEDDPEDRP